MTFKLPITTALSKLAEIARTISGINRAYSLPPEKIADMPCIFFIPGAMTPEWTQPGEDEDAIEGFLNRAYNGILIVAPLGAGVTGEMIAKTIPFFDTLIEAYMSYPELKANGYITGVQYQADSGATGAININGVDYYGIRFTVVIQTRERINYAE